jgi:voltage-gated potassium channel
MESYKSRLRIYLIIFGVVCLVGVLGFSHVEGVPFLDALYFAIVTVATVGYGDIHPKTGLGKLVAVMLIVGGVSTFLGVIANATEILLSRRDEKVRLQKLQMVTGLFFSEMGTLLLKQCIALDRDIESKQSNLTAIGRWSDRDFQERERNLSQYPYKVQLDKADLGEIKEILDKRADFLLRLLENPLVVEHGSFSDLLRAVFHLRDELVNRTSLSGLPKADCRHLEGDIARMYAHIVQEWLGSMRYLKVHYPYLFSLAVRTNPFDPEASVVVEG